MAVARSFGKKESMLRDGRLEKQLSESDLFWQSLTRIDKFGDVTLATSRRTRNDSNKSAPPYWLCVCSVLGDGGQGPGCPYQCMLQLQ